MADEEKTCKNPVCSCNPQGVGNIAAPRVKAPAKPLNLTAIADTPSVPAIFKSSRFFLKNERGA